MSSFEYCIHCDQATDHAGMADDSNFAYDMSGPYCDNCFSLYEKGRDAGMERAAEMLMHRVGNDPLLQDQTAISALVQEAKAIRKEIEK